MNSDVYLWGGCQPFIAVWRTFGPSGSFIIRYGASTVATSMPLLPTITAPNITEPNIRVHWMPWNPVHIILMGVHHTPKMKIFSWKIFSIKRLLHVVELSVVVMSSSTPTSHSLPPDNPLPSDNPNSNSRSGYWDGFWLNREFDYADISLTILLFSLLCERATYSIIKNLQMYS